MLNWLKEQTELYELNRSLRLTSAAFAKERAAGKAAGLPGYELAQIEYEEHLETALYYDEIEWIKTKRLIRTAVRYSVPIPTRAEGEDWEQSRHLGHWLLTPVGATKLRREVAVEVDIRQKPWLNWLAVAISAASLVVALFALGSA
ncbi:MAG TPA: hypothetical protein VGN60_01425 [Devosia sp.]|jgi:hypothetical protein|nr:hypothetical protein [Devosia sp.]